MSPMLRGTLNALALEVAAGFIIVALFKLAQVLLLPFTNVVYLLLFRGS